jgi:hypothetical protein
MNDNHYALPVYFTKTEVKFLKFCLSESMSWKYHNKDTTQQQIILKKIHQLSEQE